jgi:IS30 family transposase
VSISTELEAQILRYYHVEKWRVGTIARQLQVHPGTVQRVLRRAGGAASATHCASLQSRPVRAVESSGVISSARRRSERCS